MPLTEAIENRLTALALKGYQDHVLVPSIDSWGTVTAASILRGSIEVTIHSRPPAVVTIPSSKITARPSGILEADVPHIQLPLFPDSA